MANTIEHRGIVSPSYKRRLEDRVQYRTVSFPIGKRFLTISLGKPATWQDEYVRDYEAERENPIDFNSARLDGIEFFPTGDLLRKKGEPKSDRPEPEWETATWPNPPIDATALFRIIPEKE